MFSEIPVILSHSLVLGKAWKLFLFYSGDLLGKKKEKGEGIFDSQSLHRTHEDFYLERERVDMKYKTCESVSQ